MNFIFTKNREFLACWRNDGVAHYLNGKDD
jgi:hypothetical protein